MCLGGNLMQYPTRNRVCSSWTRGHRANEPRLSRLQFANMKVSINDGSDWKTFSVLLKPSQRLIRKACNCLEVGLSRSKKTRFSQDVMWSDSCMLGAWWRLLTKNSYLGSCLFFG